MNDEHLRLAHRIGYTLWCAWRFVALFVSLCSAEWEPGYRIAPLTALSVAWGIWSWKARGHHCDCGHGGWQWLPMR